MISVYLRVNGLFDIKYVNYRRSEWRNFKVRKHAVIFVFLIGRPTFVLK